MSSNIAGSDVVAVQRAWPYRALNRKDNGKIKGRYLVGGWYDLGHI